jgi:hypothetical protein
MRHFYHYSCLTQINVALLTSDSTSLRSLISEMDGPDASNKLHAVITHDTSL